MYKISWNNLVLLNRGNVCVIVNVASKWGKTKVNYTQLVALHEKYGDSKVT
jgi:glutathione peroxidase-family protein